jgi:hypothetical protein
VPRHGLVAQSFDGERATGTTPCQSWLESLSSISNHSAGAFRQHFLGDWAVAMVDCRWWSWNLKPCLNCSVGVLQRHFLDENYPWLGPCGGLFLLSHGLVFYSFVGDWAVAMVVYRRRPVNLNSISIGAFRLCFLVHTYYLAWGVGVLSSSQERWWSEEGWLVNRRLRLLDHSIVRLVRLWVILIQLHFRADFTYIRNHSCQIKWTRTSSKPTTGI